MRILNELRKKFNTLKKSSDRIECPIIDVTNKAVEETANIILDYFKKINEHKIAHNQCAIFVYVSNFT